MSAKTGNQLPTLLRILPFPSLFALSYIASESCYAVLTFLRNIAFPVFTPPNNIFFALRHPIFVTNRRNTTLEHHTDYNYILLILKLLLFYDWILKDA